MLNNLKLKIQYYIQIVSGEITIQNQEDYEMARKWLKKATVICGICTVLGFIYGLIIGIVGLTSSEIPFGVLSIPLGFILGEWAFWGVAAFLLNIRQIFNIKKMVQLGAIGYAVGKQFKETHVNVTHEFGNQYKVTSHTEDKGCLFAFIAIFIRFFGWMIFSVYVGAFLTAKKLRLTTRNIKAYQMNQK